MIKQTKLVLFKGGKAIGREGGGKSPPPFSKTKKKGRKPHPLNKLLWAATCRSYYPNRAAGVEEVADRMTKLSKRVMGSHMIVQPATASSVIYDGRRRRRAYGWMLLHAQKGSGDSRGYVPVLADVDVDDIEIFLIDDLDLEFVVAGLKSSVSTIDSMIQNDADGLSFLIGCLEALGKRADADRFREFAAECRAFGRRAAEIRKHSITL